MSQRINFGKINEPVDPPNLIEIQLKSYEEFLQKDITPSKRKDMGLQAVFREVFPIASYDEKMTLDFTQYEIGEPKLTTLQAIRDAETFSAPLYVTYELRDEAGAIKPAEMLYISLSFDHRVVDGAVGATFGNALAKHLRNPAALLLK